MYSPKDRLELAAKVIKLQEKIQILRCQKPKTEEDRKKNDQELKITQYNYQQKKDELQIMCRRERFVEDKVEMALL